MATGLSRPRPAASARLSVWPPHHRPVPAFRGFPRPPLPRHWRRISGCSDARASRRDAKPRRRKIPIDELLVGIGRFVFLESFDFLRCRRQTEQVELEPANQRAASRLGVRLDPGLVEFLLNEEVDRVRLCCREPQAVSPAGTTSVRRPLPSRIPATSRPDRSTLEGSRSPSRSAAVPSAASVPKGRYSSRVAAASYSWLRRERSTGPASPPARASFLRSRRRPPFCLSGTVAREAVLREDRLHVAVEVDSPDGTRRRGGLRTGARNREDHECKNQQRQARHNMSRTARKARIILPRLRWRFQRGGWWCVLVQRNLSHSLK